MWRKSSACGTNACVEVATTSYGETTRVAVRDSKNPHHPALLFTHAEWQAFVAGVKNGEFDL